MNDQFTLQQSIEDSFVNPEAQQTPDFSKLDIQLDTIEGIALALDKINKEASAQKEALRIEDAFENLRNETPNLIVAAELKLKKLDEVQEKWGSDEFELKINEEVDKL